MRFGTSKYIEPQVAADLRHVWLRSQYAQQFYSNHYVFVRPESGSARYIVRCNYCDAKEFAVEVLSAASTYHARRRAYYVAWALLVFCLLALTFGLPYVATLKSPAPGILLALGLAGAIIYCIRSFLKSWWNGIYTPVNAATNTADRTHDIV